MNCCQLREADELSIDRTSAILPSPAKSADNRSYVYYIHLYRQAPPIPGRTLVRPERHFEASPSGKPSLAFWPCSCTLPLCNQRLRVISAPCTVRKSRVSNSSVNELNLVARSGSRPTTASHRENATAEMHPSLVS